VSVLTDHRDNAAAVVMRRFADTDSDRDGSRLGYGILSHYTTPESFRSILTDGELRPNVADGRLHLGEPPFVWLTSGGPGFWMDNNCQHEMVRCPQFIRINLDMRGFGLVSQIESIDWADGYSLPSPPTWYVSERPIPTSRIVSIDVFNKDNGRWERFNEQHGPVTGEFKPHRPTAPRPRKLRGKRG